MHYVPMDCQEPGVQERIRAEVALEGLQPRVEVVVFLLPSFVVKPFITGGAVVRKRVFEDVGSYFRLGLGGEVAEAAGIRIRSVVIVKMQYEIQRFLEGARAQLANKLVVVVFEMPFECLRRFELLPANLAGSSAIRS